MMIVSLNLHGLGGHDKFLYLRDFFKCLNPSFIFIKETLHPTDHTLSFFRAMFLAWHMVVKDAEGRFGGLAALWDPRWASLKAFSFFGGILLTGYFRGFSHKVHLINL